MKCQTCKGPREGSAARICTGCERWLWEALTDLEGMYGALCTVSALQPAYAPPEPDPGQPRVKGALPVRSSKPKSKSPAQDDVIVLTDIRSKTEKGHPASIPGVLRDWVSRVPTDRPDPDSSVADYLRRVWDYSLAQSWIVEVVRNVRAVHRRAEVMLQEAEAEQRPVGRCWQDTCRGALFLEGHLVICGMCGVFTDGFELVQAYEPPEQPDNPMMTTAQLAEHFDARPGTIRVWLHRAGLERDAQGLVDVRRITEWLTTRPIPRVA